MLRIFIGYDPNETVAYHVCAHSIIRNASVPVSIIPVDKRTIPGFSRGKEDGSTAFSFSRFLTPYLAGHTGQAVFVDADILFRCDVAELVSQCDLHHDVFVVKHNYECTTKTKFFGNKQHAYPRKNWSSVMVFNCFSSACRRLTPEVVNTASGAYLHRFEWCDDKRIGELPVEFNHLVGEYPPNPNAKIIHYTLGTPCISGYENQEWAQEWYEELQDMCYSMSPAYNIKLEPTDAN